MKTMKSRIHVLKIIGIFLTGFLFVASCNSQVKKDDTPINASQVNIKPPKVDIHTAVVTDNLEALQQHIAAGSDINTKDPFGGSTPLISATVFGKTEAAKILINAGAELDVQNNDGSTALHTAAFFCHPEIVQMLLKNNADTTIRNKFGATAYESVAGSFAEVKEAYDMMGAMLSPMGLTLDYDYLKKTRPVIAEMLKNG